MIYKLDLSGKNYQNNYRSILVRIQCSYVLIMYYSDLLGVWGCPFSLLDSPRGFKKIAYLVMTGRKSYALATRAWANAPDWLIVSLMARFIVPW